MGFILFIVGVSPAYSWDGRGRYPYDPQTPPSPSLHCLNEVSSPKPRLGPAHASFQTHCSERSSSRGHESGGKGVKGLSPGLVTEGLLTPS